VNEPPARVSIEDMAATVFVELRVDDGRRFVLGKNCTSIEIMATEHVHVHTLVGAVCVRPHDVDALIMSGEKPN